MSFEKAVARVLKAEGGYTNHPADKGGPTNFGITQDTLAAYRGKSVTADDVKNLTQQEAEAIYKAKYWNPMGCENVRDENCQLILFDQGVNRGVKTASLQAQQVVNTYTGSKLSMDGKIGGITGGAINGMNAADFQREYLQASEHAYIDIIKRNNSQIVFASGWLNRIHALQDICWTGGTAVELKPVPKAEYPEVLPGKFAHPLDWMRNELGTTEIYGSKNNPRIVQYHKHCDNIGGEKATHPDEVPWCSSILNCCADEMGLYKTNNALASSWDKYPGEALKKGDWVEAGDIVRVAHPGGHVTLANKRFQWTGSGTFEGIGGNQGNMCKVSVYNQNTIVSVHKWKAKDGVTLGAPQSKYTPVGATKPNESTR